MTSIPSGCAVRAVHCDHRASDEEVYRALVRATDPLDRAWNKLKRAHRIGVKLNQVGPLIPRVHAGRLQEIVDPAVGRAVLRLLRERTDAEIICTEISISAHNAGQPPEETLVLRSILEEYDVPFVDGDVPPHRTYDVPGGGLMFERYLLPESVMDVDAFVSVQPMKCHLYMGVTLCLKNLFGLTPMEPHGRSRAYFHHLIRLGYVLADLGQLVQPTLNIIDGLVGQSHREWGGPARIGDTLVAGDHVISTDACGAYLMGFHPLLDWPHQPYLRDRNALRIAHDAGFGTADITDIDFRSEIEAPVADFHTAEIDPFETVLAWRRSACEQALYYRDHRREFAQKYTKKFILLQDNEVKWHSEDSTLNASRRKLAGKAVNSAMYLKLVDPDEIEGEHFEVYENELARIEAMDL